MVKDLFVKGVQAEINDAEAYERDRTKTLRGGNTGMMTEDGTIIGTCAASTYLRYEGIKLSSVTVEKELMFSGGRINEDHWLKVLKRSYDGPILCEEEIGISWETDTGVKVTGRPDIVLCEMQGEEVKPKCGIELKQIMSVNSGYNVLVKGEPQLKHLMQSAHYMWQLDCEFELWYTNRNNLDMPSWMEFRQFPPPHEGLPLSYRYYRLGDINPRTKKPKKHQITEAQFMGGEFGRTFFQATKITPFIKGFKLKLDENGQLHYQDADTPEGPWVPTIVTIGDIQRFYSYISQIEKAGVVPAPALNLTPSGDKLGWDFSAYSDLGDLDPAYQQGRNLQEWLAAVRTKVEEGGKK